jgi:hypothetical protein
MDQFIKYYKDRPIQFSIPSNGGVKLSVKLVDVKNGLYLEDNQVMKVIILSLLNKEDYKVFTDGMVQHYITKELESVLKLFSIENDFIISFS